MILIEVLEIDFAFHPCVMLACVETLKAFVKVLRVWRQCIREGVHGEGCEAVRPYKNLRLFHKD